MRLLLLLTTLACILPSIYGHTYLVSPKPRNFAAYQRTPAVTGGDIIKYPYVNGKNSIPGWCGSPSISQTAGTVFASTIASNFPAPPVTTSNTYEAGGMIKVYWYHAISHTDNNVGTALAPKYTYGIRVAVNYSATDMVVLNIHKGGTTASPIAVVNTHIEQGTGYDPMAVQDPGYVPNATFVLPTGKTCNPCTLQFWLDASSDGGSYIDCADIKIVTPATTTTTATPTTAIPTAIPTSKTPTATPTPTVPAPTSGTNTGSTSTTPTDTPTASTPSTPNVDPTASPTPTTQAPFIPTATPFPSSNTTNLFGSASTTSSHVAFVIVSLMMCMMLL